MTKRQEQQAYRRVNAAAVALILAESALMETPVTRKQVLDWHNSRLGPILDAAHETVWGIIGPAEEPKPRKCPECQEWREAIVALIQSLPPDAKQLVCAKLARIPS